MSTNRIVQHKMAIIEALEQSLGVITTACKKVGISRDTYYRYLKTDPDFAEKVKDIDNIALDFAESQLHKQIKDGSTAATIFFLKTKGRHRGYIERHEVELTEKEKIIYVDAEDSSYEDLQAESPSEGESDNQ